MKEFLARVPLICKSLKSTCLNSQLTTTCQLATCDHLKSCRCHTDCIIWLQTSRQDGSSPNLSQKYEKSSDTMSEYNECGMLCSGVESVSYALYLHRLELRRPKRFFRVMRVASTKLQLTNELISLQQRQWQLVAPSYQQRCALDRERQYRDLLRYNMQQHMLKMQHRRRQHLLATLNKH